MLNNNNKENKMTFKVNSNDRLRVKDLACKLHDNDVRVWVKLDMTDISNCQWRWIDSPTSKPWSLSKTRRSRLHTGGIGALIRELQEACFAHGIMKRPEHISNRSHVRLAVNGRPVWTTGNGG